VLSKKYMIDYLVQINLFTVRTVPISRLLLY